MTIMTTAGSTLSMVATVPATYDSAGFTALTGWVPVGEITDLGQFGRTYTIVKHISIGDRMNRKLKGSYDNGNMQLKLARDKSDAGQTLAQTALTSDASYYFKLVLQDSSIIYFSAKVMDYVTSLGNVDQVMAASMTLEIDNDIIEA